MHHITTISYRRPAAPTNKATQYKNWSGTRRQALPSRNLTNTSGSIVMVVDWLLCTEYNPCVCRTGRRQ
jgi:hypothetical protein